MKSLPTKMQPRDRNVFRVPTTGAVYVVADNMT